MGQLHPRELHPDGVSLKHAQGVEYALDGTTVTASLFQRIADGAEAPSGEIPRLLYQDDCVAAFVPLVSRDDNI